MYIVIESIKWRNGSPCSDGKVKVKHALRGELSIIREKDGKEIVRLYFRELLKALQALDVE